MATSFEASEFVSIVPEGYPKTIVAGTIEQANEAIQEALDKIKAPLAIYQLVNQALYLSQVCFMRQEEWRCATSPDIEIAESVRQVTWLVEQLGEL